MSEISVDEALRRAISAHKQGEIEQAERLYNAILKSMPNHPDANHNLGVLAKQLNMHERALELFDAAISANPKIEQFWVSKIDTYFQIGDYRLAEQTLNDALHNEIKSNKIKQLQIKLAEHVGFNRISQEPSRDQLKFLVRLHQQKKFDRLVANAHELLSKHTTSLGLHNILGATYSTLENYPFAIKYFKKGLSINPNIAELHFNLGNAYGAIGKLEAALECYSRALNLKKDYVEAAFNAGNIYLAQHDFLSAIKSYKHALEYKNNHVNALVNLGNSYKELGEISEAISIYKLALKLSPGDTLIYHNLALILTNLEFRHCDFELLGHAEKLLEFKMLVRPKDLSRAVISMLKANDNFRSIFNKISIDSSLKTLLYVINELVKYPAFGKLLCLCPVADLQIEQLLRRLRYLLLLNLDRIDRDDSLACFQSILAQQCFINEYIYEIDECEQALLSQLIISLEQKVFDGKKQLAKELLCLASYTSLDKYDWIEHETSEIELQNVIQQQIIEPSIELSLKDKITVISQPTNSVSKDVRDQYEDNPYPRWIKPRAPIKPLSISDLVGHLNLQLWDSTIMQRTQPSVLIAGCGTGQQAIESSLRLENPTMVAVDLSLSSLAYATRKTRELALSDITYLQCDILELGSLGKEFDIIECTGVLHHMEDPMAGWKTLTSLLKPGGLMKIGLYSKKARADIIKIRKQIDLLGIKDTNKGMIEFREKMIKSDEAIYDAIKYSDDFFTRSTLRDLLFHVQEHQFSITQIRNYLHRLGLVVCGFEHQRGLKDLKEIFFETKRVNWKKIIDYENRNPRIFAGMYQFWCQKVDIKK